MAYLINLKTFDDEKGTLTVVEDILPFKVKRTYYVYNVNSIRGGHRHKLTVQGLVCLGGSCKVYVNNGKTEKEYIIDTPQKCLILDPKDWHTIDFSSNNTVLLVFASEYYDVDDYVDDKY